jgi:hypothetical protein
MGTIALFGLAFSLEAGQRKLALAFEMRHR